MAQSGRDGKPSPRVSFDDEKLILVNERNEVVGYEDKRTCHEGDGILHRAFSVFLFDEQGRLLLQKRAAGKPLWPLHWSNSVCSHPRQGEDEGEAVRRRIREEIGPDADVTDVSYVYRFRYHARFGDVGSEREDCAVYLGRVAGEIVPNLREIAEWRWIVALALDREIAEIPEVFTPWMKEEWVHLRSEESERLLPYLS